MEQENASAKRTCLSLSHVFLRVFDVFFRCFSERYQSNQLREEEEEGGGVEEDGKEAPLHAAFSSAACVMDHLIICFHLQLKGNESACEQK